MARMNQASQDRLYEIEAWFLAHEDGEFAVARSDYSSVRIGDAATARTIVYTTKHQCLPRIRNLSQLLEPIATLGRYGLPAADDLRFVCGSSPTRIFIGDCDPPDILVFAWLREHLPIVWHGVNDDFLEGHGTRSMDWIRIPLSVAERKTVSILPQLCPDFRELLGEYCSSVIDDGFKIELEGAISDRNVEAEN
jgi:hypothetical protein